MQQSVYLSLDDSDPNHKAKSGAHSPTAKSTEHLLLVLVPSLLKNVHDSLLDISLRAAALPSVSENGGKQCLRCCRSSSWIFLGIRLYYVNPFNKSVSFQELSVQEISCIGSGSRIMSQPTGFLANTQALGRKSFEKKHTINKFCRANAR